MDNVIIEGVNRWSGCFCIECIRGAVSDSFHFLPGRIWENWRTFSSGVCPFRINIKIMGVWWISFGTTIGR